MRRLLPLALLSLTAAAPPPASRDFGAERARLAALNAREAALAAKIGANRSSLIRLLGALEMWRRDPPPALLVSPQRARDAARAAILLKAIAPELERRAQAFSVEAKALARTRREAAEAAGALFAAESARAEHAGAGRGGVPRGAGDPLDAALLDPQERAATAGAQGDPLALGTETARGAGTEGPSPARLLSPLPGAAPTRRFGEAWAGRGRSEGLAFAAPPDAVVRAPADGEVEYAGPLRAWRLVAILKLDSGWRVVLAGMQRIDAGVGVRVAAGEPLGRTPPAASPSPSGKPGELYMELRRGAQPIDPGPLLARR